MTDYTELKRLAEALNRAIAQAEHKPGEWAETAQSMGGICCPGEPFQIGKPLAKEEPWAQFSYKRDSWLAVAAVNALPKFLTLIAENERLRDSDQEATELCDTLSVLLGEIAVAVRGPEEPKSRHGFHDQPSRVKTVVAERDQLKAKNEVLHKALTECSDSLHGEMLQKFGGQLPGDMHPVTRREYDRDMAELAGYRAAMGKREQA